MPAAIAKNEAIQRTPGFAVAMTHRCLACTSAANRRGAANISGGGTYTPAWSLAFLIRTGCGISSCFRSPILNENVIV